MSSNFTNQSGDLGGTVYDDVSGDPVGTVYDYVPRETKTDTETEAKNWITTRGIVTIAIVIAVFVIAYLIAKKQTS